MDPLFRPAMRPALDAFARRVIAAYGIPADAALRLVNLSENATYRVDADGSSFALRVHREGYHSRAAIASELSWLMALRQAGVAITPKPVKGLDGEILQQARPDVVEGIRHFVLFEWEAGEEPVITADLSAHFATLGEVTARMHQHARQWRRPEGFTRLVWDFEGALGEANPHWGRWRDGIGMDAAKANLFGRTVDVIGARLKAYGMGPERFGLIHSDLRLANLLVDGKAVKVIDFDDCGFSWFMYDAATPVSFHEHEPQVPGLIESWKEGYRRAAPLAAEDEAEIPTFLMLRRLLLVAWIGSHHETDLARSMGQTYTDGTMALCEDYLGRMG